MTAAGWPGHEGSLQPRSPCCGRRVRPRRRRAHPSPRHAALSLNGPRPHHRSLADVALGGLRARLAMGRGRQRGRPGSAPRRAKDLRRTAPRKKLRIGSAAPGCHGPPRARGTS
eukprot:2922281-Alexandrium_andersonii.AAC.1